MSTSHRIGRSDLMVYPLALGGNVFGWTADEADSFTVLDAYTAAGGNFIDTADAYSSWAPGNNGGESETIIGNWMASRRNRSDVIIASKVGSHPAYQGLSPSNIRAACDASLRRLRTDYIDLYYTHFDDLSQSVEDIIITFDALVKAGKVRAIGASNLSAERLEQSLTFSDCEKITRYDALQPHYNLVSRSTYEGALRDTAAQYGLSVLPYWSLASGFLTGKYRLEGTHTNHPRSQDAAPYASSDRGKRVIAALEEIAAERRVEMATVALAWLVAQPTVVAPITSARTVSQLPPLLAAVGFQLAECETLQLTSASA